MTARELIEASRHLARLSRDEMLPQLQKSLKGLPDAIRNDLYPRYQEQRMNLVMDCYLTGCAETLKHLMGNTEPEPWETYEHEARLNQLLAEFRQYQAEQTEALARGQTKT